MPEQQNIILIDPNDNMIGEIEKHLGHKYGMLHRAFSIILFRRKHNKIETLIQQRSMKKYHGGGLWSNSCCSHAVKGQDIIDTAAQRLQHEVSIQAKLSYAGKFHYIAKLDNGYTENEIDHVFVGNYTEDNADFNKDEVENLQWINTDTLLNNIAEQPNRYTPWFSQVIDIGLSHYTKEDTCKQD